MGYVETLFGHQDHVLALDALRADTCVSVGGRDKTVRYWKIVDETQLVFRGGGRSRVREVLEGGLRGDDEDGDDDDMGDGQVDKKAKGKGKGEGRFVEGSIESVAMIDETTFVSGGDSGLVFFPFNPIFPANQYQSDQYAYGQRPRKSQYLLKLSLTDSTKRSLSPRVSSGPRVG